VHLVFVTKYRREIFTKETLDDLRPIFSSVCANFEAELVAFDGEDDHIHLLVDYPPKVSASNLVNSLKGVSSRMIRKNPSIRKKLWGRRANRGYPTVHRTAADSALKSKARTALPFALLPPEGRRLPHNRSRQHTSASVKLRYSASTLHPAYASRRSSSCRHFVPQSAQTQWVMITAGCPILRTFTCSPICVSFA
jgi:REP element-mobilizing transposase RayT